MDAARPRRPAPRAAAAVVGLLIAAFVFSPAVRAAFFVFFFAFLLAVVLDYPVRLLARFVRRGAAALLVLLAILAGMAGTLRLAVPALLDEGSRVLAQMPRTLERAEAWWDDLRPGPGAAEPEAGPAPRPRAGDALAAALPVAGTTIGVLTGILATLVIASFMVASPATYADGIVRFVPPHAEAATRELLRRLVRTVRSWMAAQVVAMTFVGTATAIGLWALGVKSWPALAAVNFLCEFVPYVGPVIGALPGFAVAFAQSPRLGLAALALYVGIQQFEGYLVSPLVMKHEVRLAPPVLLLFQVLMGAAFGVLGVLIATPLLACLKVTVDYFWIERALGRTPAPLE